MLQRNISSGYGFFYNPNYLTAEKNFTDLGTIVLDLFQFSLLDKNRLQSQYYISNIMYNCKLSYLNQFLVLASTSKIGELGSRLLSIDKKMTAISAGKVFKTSIKDIFNVLSDNKGKLNLYAKFMKILEIYSDKSEIKAQDGSVIAKK